MKLSISWIFDHIKQSWKSIDIKDAINKFSLVSAEIEKTKFIELNLDEFTLVKVIDIKDNIITAKSYELNKELTFPTRSNAIINDIYLVKKDESNKKNAFNWAKLSDLGSSKDGLLTNLWCNDDELSGTWKKNINNTDYIIELDNKAVTNRPDMWGHRGFAREFAALLKLDLLPEEDFLDSKTVKHYISRSPVSATNPFTIEVTQLNNETKIGCKRFAALYFKDIKNHPSSIKMAFRLAQIDAKPINFIVDCTNYVMYDLGQPTHAFDANSIETNNIVTRFAKNGEKLTLLDGENITLTNDDYVITNGIYPISLAGIMGGQNSEVKPSTTSILLESANFDPTVIRQTSLKVKKRTDASARFEKSLDPNQNTQAILRFLKLLDEEYYKHHQNPGQKYQTSEFIVSIGSLIEENIIQISQKFINERLGIQISSESIDNILTRLGFGVQSSYDKNEHRFNITVPTFRSTKDILIKEDIVEEIGRFFGYDKIPLKLPTRNMSSFDISRLTTLRTIKKHLAYGLSMNETQTYAFYDESFLKHIDYNPTDTIKIKNPQSENWQQLVSSLIPNLLQGVEINHSKYSTVRLFEINRVWFMDNNYPIESQELAGIFYDKNPLDFYECKATINTLWDILKIDVEWSKSSSQRDYLKQPWFDQNQTADILYKNKIIGRAGKVSKIFLNKIAQGDAFIFEFNADFILSKHQEQIKFKSLPKYPEVNLDISLLVDLKVTAEQLINIIKKSDTKIKQVIIKDFYQKPEWVNQKSITINYTLYDENKTLTKEEIDSIVTKITENISKIGSQVR